MPIDHVLDLLCCPLCAASVTRRDNSVVCGSGHNFDLARQGYLNLLGRAAPANADTADMIAARARFLATGAYRRLADAIIKATGEGAPQRFLEVGAGTGYYLASVLDRLGGRGIAIDVSPAAARRAARAHDQLGAVVADVWQSLPLPDASIDALLCVFAPRHAAEFGRVLASGSRLVIASPLPDHLAELRGPLGLLGIEAGKEDRTAAMLADHFDPVSRIECRYRIDLQADAVGDLVSMGPNAYHQDPRRLIDHIAGLDLPVSVTVAVSISAWQPRPRP